MKLNPFSKGIVAMTSLLITTWMPFGTVGQSCAFCHVDEYSKWVHSVHANTQADVAGELRDSHPGESPDSVIQGEDCIACHAPTAVLVNAG